MARIREFMPSNQNVKIHPTEVDCEYTTVEKNGVRMLHLSTFGSDERASERKSSQSMQLDIERARELIDIIVKAFPSLRRP